jgi:uncharacterized protein (DUF305 family)
MQHPGLKVQLFQSLSWHVFLTLSLEIQSMKQHIILACLGSAILVACNNGGSETAVQMDSSAQTSTTENTATTPATVDSGMVTTTASTVSLMDMMDKNMQDMKAVPSSNNPDNDFASLMKMHHMGALEMAQAEVTRGTNAEMKTMAQKMIDEQQKEIAELNTFLSGHNAHGGGDGFYKKVMAQMTNTKMEMDHAGSFDKQFAQMMIPHHQGAIDMSKAYLKSGAHEEKLKTMANKIIANQQKEIGELQAWLAKNK